MRIPRLDSADFHSWLDTRSGIEADAERDRVGCERCGISESVCPFMRGHCYTCLGYLYGQFVKCQQLVMWADRHIPFVARGDLNDRATALVALGQNYRVPRANKTAEPSFSGHSPFAEADR